MPKPKPAPQALKSEALHRLEICLENQAKITINQGRIADNQGIILSRLDLILDHLGIVVPTDFEMFLKGIEQGNETPPEIKDRIRLFAGALMEQMGRDIPPPATLLLEGRFALGWMSTPKGATDIPKALEAFLDDDREMEWCYRKGKDHEDTGHLAMSEPLPRVFLDRLVEVCGREDLISQ